MKRVLIVAALFVGLVSPTVVPAITSSATGIVVGVSVGDASVWEGNSGGFRTGSLSLTLSAPSAEPVSITYRFEADSATASSDFRALPSPGVKTVVFPAGSTMRFISVEIYPDREVEGDEYFGVILADPSSGVEVVDGRGDVTIRDDEAVSGTLSVSAASVREGDSGGPRAVRFWVSLADPATAVTSVRVLTVQDGGRGQARPGTEYKALSRTVTFLNRQYKKAFTIPILPDVFNEGDEVVLVALDSVVGAVPVAPSSALTISNDDSTPVPTHFTAISAGGKHSCALALTGEVWCWGSNQYMKLGAPVYGFKGRVPGTWDSDLPVRVLGVTGAVQVSAGVYGSCAVLIDASVTCWGAWGLGGRAFVSRDSGGTSDALPVTGLTAVKQVSVGSLHVCAVRTAGDVWCWGSDGSGQLGDAGDSGSFSQLPVKVVGVSDAVSVETGNAFSCALLVEGTVQCWGSNTFGNLGDGTTTDSGTPRNVAGIAGAVEITVGGYHACARMPGGTIKCWGMNRWGQLGDGNAGPALGGPPNPTNGLCSPNCPDSPVPVDVVGVAGATSVSARAMQTCAVASDSTVLCWGGVVLPEWAPRSPLPTEVPGLSGAAVVASGGATESLWVTEHSCALLLNGKAECWGANEYGQLGDHSMTNAIVPVQVATGL